MFGGIGLRKLQFENDLVPTVISSKAGTDATTTTLAFKVITRLSPSLVTVNLSDNVITNASLAPEALRSQRPYPFI